MTLLAQLWLLELLSVVTIERDERGLVEVLGIRMLGWVRHLLIEVHVWCALVAIQAPSQLANVRHRCDVLLEDFFWVLLLEGARFGLRRVHGGPLPELVIQLLRLVFIRYVSP